MTTDKTTPSLFDVLRDTPAADAEGFAVVAGLAALARRHRAAEALAEEEYLLGVHVDESEPDEQSMLLAAQDEEAPTLGLPVVFTAGRMRVRVQRSGPGFVAVQEAGPLGLTLRTPAGSVPLQRGVGVLLSGVRTMPEVLEGLDRKGRRVALMPTSTDRSDR